MSLEPFLVCSGGTTSRCAANGCLTIDMRHGFNEFLLEEGTNNLKMGSSHNMISVLIELAKKGRAFPAGLSGLPGIGYIITGGVSPLSRSQGLAIDQILKLEGFWGNGKRFCLTKPTSNTDKNKKIMWKGLCGAAPFLGVITSLKLETTSIPSIQVIKIRPSTKQLSNLIREAEKWPNTISLQWFWKDRITAYIVILLQSKSRNQQTIEIRKNLLSNYDAQAFFYTGLNSFYSLLQEEQPTQRKVKVHSEVISLLSPGWGTNSEDLTQKIKMLLEKRPHPECSIASQQLGGNTKINCDNLTSFIHREAIWKPWITGSWNAGDASGKKSSLRWVLETWEALEPFCPWIHMAQLHSHLPWHQREIDCAFGDWLPGLKQLKDKCDPNNLMAPL
ncbi:FAD-binding oxidoreductase [Prochlorococcus sp. MIT 1300]|uniref:FAD-binding oxidoreductase n=1 Tax=Prochlorococcus sp. MIT 1300 TaxID=3096218 RepID=UPI0039BF87D2